MGSLRYRWACVHAARALAAWPLALATVHAQAFATFPYTDNGETLYAKWGEDHHAGTAGGAVTWSLIPPGTAGAAYCGGACPGTSSATIPVELSPGGGFAPKTLAELTPTIQADLRRWSASSGIRFVEVADAGLPIDDPDAVPPATGQIRFGIFAFSAGGGAVGYAPPPNGGTGAGDVLLDANSYYQFAPGTEGTPFDTTYAPNDLEGLLMHEIGHALGLAHPPDDGVGCPLMQSLPRCNGVVQRVLDADDLAGIDFLYGEVFHDGFEP